MVFFIRGTVLAAILFASFFIRPSVPQSPVARAALRIILPLIQRKLLAQDESFTVAAPALPSSRLILRYEVSGECIASILLPNGKPLPVRVEKGDDVRIVYATVPASHPYGA